MNNFEFFNPTRIIFGKNRINNVGKIVKEYTKNNNILLVISESSKKNGILDIVTASLNEQNINYYILDGIVSNPVLDCVYKGKSICEKNNIDFVLGIGGGSVIDTAKTIAVAAYHNEDIWDLVCNPLNIKGAISLGTIITLYGSGTEMTNGAVISNTMIPKKRGFDSKFMYPKFSILDSTTLESCDRNYLLIGMTDMLTHVLEEYFEITDDNNFSDEFQELLVNKMIDEFKKVSEDNFNNEKLLWMSTLAQNKFLSFGKKYNGEWVAHILAHEFCIKYNFPHGRVVAILFISWLKFIKDINEKRIISFGEKVFNLKNPSAIEVINKLQEIYTMLGNPLSLSDLGANKEDIDEIVNNAMFGKVLGKYKVLDKNDVKRIILGAYYGN